MSGLGGEATPPEKGATPSLPAHRSARQIWTVDTTGGIDKTFSGDNTFLVG